MTKILLESERCYSDKYEIKKFLQEHVNDSVYVIEGTHIAQQVKRLQENEPNIHSDISFEELTHQNMNYVTTLRARLIKDTVKEVHYLYYNLDEDVDPIYYSLKQLCRYYNVSFKEHKTKY